MNALDRRLLRLESSGRFMPDVPAMTDDEVVGLLAAAGNDQSRHAAILKLMSDEQMVRLIARLKNSMRAGNGQRPSHVNVAS